MEIVESAVMANTSVYNSALVRIWILEYACKFKMKKVVYALTKQGPWKCFGCARESQHCINPIYLVSLLFEDLMENVKLLLQKGLTLSTLRTIDKGTLHICVNCLEVLYLQKETMPFACFYKLLYALKLVILIISMVDGDGKEQITQLLDILFPSFSRGLHAQYAKQFRLTKEEAASHDSKEREARAFIQQLLLRHGRQENYPSDCLVPQAKALLRNVVDVIPEIVRTAITPYMTVTFIEKMLEGNEEKIYTENDPSVKLLLEFLHPGVQEEELLCALRALDPTNEIISLVPNEPSISSPIPTPSEEECTLPFFDMD